jgi:transcriptional regulator with XRE-family HTH domain
MVSSSWCIDYEDVIMKLNQQLFRARRRELGLTSREVARCANVSLAVIKRIEDTGDVSVLQVSTLTAILKAISLDLFDALDQAPRPPTANDLTTAIGGLLMELKRGAAHVEIASTLGITLDKIEPALEALDANLRPAGLQVHRGSNGVSIVPTVRLDLGSNSYTERLRYLSKINSGDVALLYRAVSERVPANTVASNANGTVSLRKLEAAGLAHVCDNILQPTELTSMMLDLAQ